MKIIIFLLYLSALNNAWAFKKNGEDENPAASKIDKLAAKFKEIHQYCINDAAHLKNMSCDFKPNRSLLRSEDFAVGDYIQGGIEGIAAVGFCASDSLLLSDEMRGIRSQAKNAYEATITAMKDKALEMKLEPCKVVCMAKCMSSKWLEYTRTFVQNTHKSIASGTGDCKHFSKIGADILTKLGIKASAVGGKTTGPVKKGHDIVKVSFDSDEDGVIEDYYIEPQDNFCHFYDIVHDDSQEEITHYLDKRRKSLKVNDGPRNNKEVDGLPTKPNKKTSGSKI